MPGTRWTAVVAIAAVLLLAGCSPEPEPTPTPTGFATEAEAFAAAEETYRAYNDATNQIDISDPATFEPMLMWTTGEQHDIEKKSLSELHADGVVVTGDTEIVGLELDDWDADGQTISISVCHDVSDVEVVDATGVSLVAPDRLPLQPKEVTLSSSSRSSTGFLIDGVVNSEGNPVCVAQS